MRWYLIFTNAGPPYGRDMRCLPASVRRPSVLNLMVISRKLSKVDP